MTTFTPPEQQIFNVVRSAWIEINGISLRYSIEGAGDPVIFLHEMGGCIESWDSIAREIATTKAVIRYDQRSAGQSEKVVAGFSLDDLASDLESLIAQLGITSRVHLVGAAAGAAQAMIYAARHPQMVASIAMLAPATDISDESRALVMHRSEQAIKGGMRSILADSLDRAWPEDRRANTTYFHQFRGRYLATDPHSFAQHNAALAMIDLGDIASKIACPVLVIAGSHDKVRPVESLRAFVERVPTASMVVVEAAHFIAAEASDEVVEQLNRFYPDSRSRAPRHSDLVEEDLTPSQRIAIAEASDGARGRVPAPMRAWLPSTEFARRAQALGETLRYHTSLPPRLSELAILVTARFWRSNYEWRVHSAAAANAGLASDTIEDIRCGLLPNLTAEDEQIVFAVSLAIHQEHQIGDELFNTATRVLGRAGLAELVGILGYYSLVSMTLNTYQIDSTDRAPSPFSQSFQQGASHA